MDTMQAPADNRELMRILRNGNPPLARDSCCGICGGEIMFSRYSGEPRCVDCKQLHELQDVWLFEPRKKPVVVKDWGPVDEAIQEQAELSRQFKSMMQEDSRRMFNQLWYFVHEVKL
jgi:hypothetical protein